MAHRCRPESTQVQAKQTDAHRCMVRNCTQGREGSCTQVQGQTGRTQVRGRASAHRCGRPTGRHTGAAEREGHRSNEVQQQVRAGDESPLRVDEGGAGEAVGEVEAGGDVVEEGGLAGPGWQRADCAHKAAGEVLSPSDTGGGGEGQGAEGAGVVREDNRGERARGEAGGGKRVGQQGIGHLQAARQGGELT